MILKKEKKSNKKYFVSLFWEKKKPTQKKIRKYLIPSFFSSDTKPNIYINRKKIKTLLSH